MSMSEIKTKEFSIGYGKVKKAKVGKYNPLVFIGGPCAIESKDHSLKMASRINKICERLKISFVLNPVLIRIVDPLLKVLMVLD